MSAAATFALAVIGAGRAGTALALALCRQRWPVVAVASRTPASAERLARLTGAQACHDAAAAARQAEAVIIATPDAAIAATAADLAAAGGLRAGQVVLHLSGALDSSLLAPARSVGAAAGSLHPLQTLPDGERGATLLQGCYFGIEGDPLAVAAAAAMARAVGGTPLPLPPGSKPLYHAAAVAASNYICATAHLAAALWTRAGLPRPLALPALLPLLQGAVANLERLGLPAALTGPIERGDAATVRRHLAHLDRDSEVALAYRTLGVLALQLAEAKGLPAAAAAQVRSALAGTDPEMGDLR